MRAILLMCGHVLCIIPGSRQGVRPISNSQKKHIRRSVRSQVITNPTNVQCSHRRKEYFTSAKLQMKEVIWLSRRAHPHIAGRLLLARVTKPIHSNGKDAQLLPVVAEYRYYPPLPRPVTASQKNNHPIKQWRILVGLCSHAQGSRGDFHAIQQSVLVTVSSPSAE